MDKVMEKYLPVDEASSDVKATKARKNALQELIMLSSLADMARKQVATIHADDVTMWTQFAGGIEDLRKTLNHHMVALVGIAKTKNK